MEWVISLGVSIMAVIVLVLCARLLNLGPPPRLDDCGTAFAIARFEGFSPTAIALAADGSAALARDAERRWLLICRHGVHWITRTPDDATVTILAHGHKVMLTDGRVLNFPPLTGGPFACLLEGGQAIGFTQPTETTVLPGARRQATSR